MGFFTTSIRRKILSIFAIVIIFVLVMVSAGFYQLNQVRHSAQKTVPTSLQMEFLQDFALAVSALDVNLERFLVVGSGQAQEEVVRDLDRIKSALRVMDESDDTAIRAHLTALEQVVVEMENNVLTLLEAGPSDLTPREINERILLIFTQTDQIGTLRQEAAREIANQLHQTAAEQEATAAQVMLQFLILGVLVSLSAVVASLVITRNIATPLAGLATIATRIEAGDLAAQPSVATRHDEVGQLSAAFSGMTAKLRDLINTLEDQVADRTRQLETLVEVGQRLSGILDLSDLMRQIVTLTKETFNYYHVHIYLREDDLLVMAEGYGEAGTEMKRRGHSISLTAKQSSVARAVRERQIITVEDVRDNPNWLPNSLLPDTRSEMAIPIQLSDEVVGVLDVQSEQVEGLTPEDETAMQALANQIGTVVQNARLFTETQNALYQAQELQRRYTGQAWERVNAARATTDYEVISRPELAPLQETLTPEATAALQQGQTIDLRTRASTNGSANGDHQAELPAALATPLKLRDQIIGVLGFQDENPERQWTEDEIALIEAVSEQMSLALENERLFEDTQRNAWRDQVVSEATARVWSSAEIEEVMKEAVAQLGDKLRASEVVIRLDM